MESRIKQMYQFGHFQLDPAERLLLRHNETVSIAPKVLDLLLALLERQGSVVEKNELMQLLWPDTYVEENNLTVTMSALRKTLGEGKDGTKFIETIPRRGYRFVAQVTLQQSPPASAFPQIPANTVFPEAAPGDSEPEPVDGQAKHLREDAPPPTTAATSGDMLRSSTSVAVGPRRSGTRFSMTKLLISGAVLLILAGAAVTPWIRRPPANLSEVRSIAVLPFKSLNEPSQEELADESLGLGLADALITKLSNTGRIVVRPTSAIIKYSKAAPDIIAAGRELEVDAVLDGRVQRVGDRIRITVQFIRLPDGTPLWADSYDERFTNILAVQNSISEKIAYALDRKSVV